MLRVETDSCTWHARAVISAAGTWWRPFLPAVPGQGDFGGQQLHTVQYRNPQDFARAPRCVIVVGGGNSGAQIAADLTHETHLTWATQRPPRYLADDIDGRALFDTATARRRALDEGRTDTGGVASLGARRGHDCNHAFPGQVLHIALPNGWDDIWHLPPEDEQHAIKVLFELLDEFAAESMCARSSHFFVGTWRRATAG